MNGGITVSSVDLNQIIVSKESLFALLLYIRYLSIYHNYYIKRCLKEVLEC